MSWPWLVATVTLQLLGVVGHTTFVLAARRKRRVPPARPIEDELDLGSQRPAVVNLLTHGFEVTSSAVAATILDLAQRRILVIDQVSSTLTLMGIGSGGRSRKISAYEQMVLDELDQHAEGGVVPSDACALDANQLSDQWWRRFAKAVLAEAEGEGLVDPRPLTVDSVWQMLAWLASATLTLTPIAVVLCAEKVQGMETTVLGRFATALVVLGLAAVACNVTLLLRLGPRPTSKGRSTAASWLARRANIAAVDFSDRGPAAVKVWGPYAAYAAALDLAPAIVHQIPFATDDDRSDHWSHAGGLWRHVRIEYPIWRPFWGYRPARVLVASVPVAVGAGALASVLAGVRGIPAAHPAAVLFVLVAVGAALAFVASVLDLAKPRVVEGEIVRHLYRPPSPDGWLVHRPRRYLVVDNGRSPLVAWSVQPRWFSGHQEGDLVQVTVSPLLGWIIDIRVLGPARVAEEPTSTSSP